MSLPPPTDSHEIFEGAYAASRNAWREARGDALAALGKLRAAIVKTKDARAAQASTALDRIVRRIPDMGAMLDVLAEAENGRLPEAASLKDQARKTSQLASYYLRSDRLVAMVRESPFASVSLDKLFTRALQTIQRELK